MVLRTATALLVVMTALAVAGCHGFWQHGLHGDPASPALLIQNPLYVPVRDPELVWTQLQDVLDDYFRISDEERVRLIGETPLEGRIETFPTDGSTILEPWRRDSTRGYEKWHSTFQSVRRRAVARVIPADGGFLIDLAVYKELEDINRPQHATVDRTTFRYDNALARTELPDDIDRVTLGWIPLGRDISLEQQILGQLQAKLTH
jgi:hypothetical protein